HQHGTADAERPFVLRRIRAGSHRRTHPRHDRRIEEKGPMDGRHAAPGVRRQKPQTRGQRMPPYELTAHAVTQGAAYSVADVADALRELSTWFANADLSLVRIQRQMVGRKLAASDVRCWPHHFDLATLVSFPARDADAIGYVGVGLSPGDE